jgi:hypothetical protein
MTFMTDVVVIGAGQSGLATTVRCMPAALARSCSRRGTWPTIATRIPTRVSALSWSVPATPPCRSPASSPRSQLCRWRAAARSHSCRKCRGGEDVHYWLEATGFDLLPPAWLRHYADGRTVDDTGKYQHALETGHLTGAPCSRRSPATASSGRTEHASTSTPDHASWPGVRGP